MTMVFSILRCVCAAILFVLMTSGTRAQSSAELLKKAPDANILSAIAEREGHVRIIVEFSGPLPANQIIADPALLGSVKAQIASIQDAIIATHFASAAHPRNGQGFQRGLLRFDISPMFAVNVSRTELEALAADSRVVHIHLDRLVPPVLLQSLPLIGMAGAYASGATGLGQAVAIVDTGVQSNHEFLSGKVVMEACFSNSGGAAGEVSLCPNGQGTQTGVGAAYSAAGQCINGASNLCLHGTHVAGIAAGKNTNPGGGKPDNGVAKDAKIVAIQVFTRFNDSASCGGPSPCVMAYTSDLLSALNWIFQNALNPAAGVKLASINMSLGGGQYSSACDTDPLKPAIDNLRAAGVATAIAAGNDGFTNSVSSPGCISTAVTVGSSDKNDVISSFSNMAPMVALMAPGGFGGGSCSLGGNNPDILSSVAGTSSVATNGYECLAGTSMATPHVAGSFAAIRSACPNATVDSILAALQSTGTPIADTRPGGVVSKPRIRVDLALKQLACATTHKLITDDFNGDGRSDILWRDTSGDVAIWLMSGAQRLLGAIVADVPTSWAIAGTGDFNGDGKSDILWRDASGNVAIWLMNGAQISSAAYVANVPTSWTIVGTGDFNGDGQSDILWRDASGNVAIWFMNGVTVLSGTVIANVPTSWTIVGTGDFDGDGNTDILWRDTSGNVAIWFMRGAQVLSQAYVANVPTSWTIVGTGDFNGDGKSDILWRDASGDVAIWLMNGAQPLSGAVIGTVPESWTIVGTGDFNGDGRSDILWRDASGNVAIWFMNGAQALSGATVANVPTSWTIQSRHWPN